MKAYGLPNASRVRGEKVDERKHHRIVRLASLDGCQRSGHDRDGQSLDFCSGSRWVRYGVI